MPNGLPYVLIIGEEKGVSKTYLRVPADAKLGESVPKAEWWAWLPRDDKRVSPAQNGGCRQQGDDPSWHLCPPREDRDRFFWTESEKTRYCTNSIDPL